MALNPILTLTPAAPGAPPVWSNLNVQSINIAGGTGNFDNLKVTGNLNVGGQITAGGVISGPLGPAAFLAGPGTTVTGDSTWNNIPLTTYGSFEVRPAGAFTPTIANGATGIGLVTGTNQVCSVFASCGITGNDNSYVRIRNAVNGDVIAVAGGQMHAAISVTAPVVAVAGTYAANNGAVFVLDVLNSSADVPGATISGPRMFVVDGGSLT